MELKEYLVLLCIVYLRMEFTESSEALHMEQTKMDWENARAACGQTGHILVPGRRHKASALLKLIPEGSAVWIYGWRSVIDSEQDSRGRVRSLKVDYSRPLKKPQPVVCQEDSTFSVSTRKVLVDLAERQCWSKNLEWADVRTNADYSSVMDVMGTSPHWVRSIEPSALGKQCMLARRIGTDLKYDYVACNEQHMHICLTDDDQIASFSPLVVLKMANYDEVEALILSELQPTPPPSSSVPAAVTSSLPAAVTSSLSAAVTSSLQVAVTSSLPAAGMSSVPENVTSSVPPAVTSSTVILEPSSSVTMHEKTSSTPPLAVPTTAASVKDTSSAASTMETSTSVFKSETASKSSVVQSVSDVRKTSESQLTTEVRPTTDSQSTRIGQSTSDVRRTSESQLTTEVHSITDSQSTRIGQSTSDVQSTPVAPSRSQSASEAQSTTETQSTDVAQSIPMATASLSEDSSSILLATISTKDATNTYIVSSAISPTSTRDYTAMSTTSAAVDWQKVYDEMVSFGLNNDTSTTVPDVANTTSGDLTTEIYGNKMDNTTSTDDSANITQTNELPEEHATTTTSYFIESQNDTIESTTYRTLVNDTPISTTDNIANSSDTTTKAYNRDITSFVPTSSSTTMSVSITESTSEPVTSTTSSTTSITTHIDPNSSTEDYYDFYEDYIYKGMYSTTAANEKDSEDSKDVTLATGNAEDDDKDGDSRDEEDYETNETNDAVSKQKTGSDGDEGLETSLWVAFIILAVAVIFCLILAAFLYRRRKKQKSKDITPAENGTAAAEPAVATESDEVELRDSRSPSNTRESATFRDTAYDL